LRTEASSLLRRFCRRRSFLRLMSTCSTSMVGWRSRRRRAGRPWRGRPHSSSAASSPPVLLQEATTTNDGYFPGVVGSRVMSGEKAFASILRARKPRPCVRCNPLQNLETSPAQNWSVREALKHAPELRKKRQKRNYAWGFEPATSRF
jgi:hypothetical protein